MPLDTLCASGLFFRFSRSYLRIFSAKTRLVQQRLDGKREIIWAFRNLKIPKTPQELTFLQEERKEPKFFNYFVVFPDKVPVFHTWEEPAGRK